MFASISPTLGTQAFNDFYTVDAVQRQPLGTVVTSVDPFWGTGEFIYLKSNDTIVKGSCVVWDETYTSVLCPNTANQAFPVGFAMPGAASATYYFWAQISGFTVYKTNATVAADAAMGLTAAGVLGASSAGKEIVNCRNRKAATATKTWTATTTIGTGVLVCPSGYDGAFLGMALSGTGIPASTVVAGLDPDGKRIYTGSAIGTLGDKNSTASGSITLTGTFTGYGAGVINRPNAQGRIT